jgi:hypothetical protein
MNGVDDEGGTSSRRPCSAACSCGPVLAFSANWGFAAAARFCQLRVLLWLSGRSVFLHMFNRLARYICHDSCLCSWFVD